MSALAVTYDLPRDRELDDLRRALELSAGGFTGSVLVSGGPGVGKTALIDQLRPAVTTRGGWFVCGKADQYSHDAGSNVFAQAVRALGRLLLSEPQGELQRQRELILATQHRRAHRGADIVPVGPLGDRVVDMGHLVSSQATG